MPKCANMVRVYHDFISDVGGGYLSLILWRYFLMVVLLLTFEYVISLHA
jgi:hypothetical protein